MCTASIECTLCSTGASLKKDGAARFISLTHKLSDFWKVIRAFEIKRGNAKQACARGCRTGGGWWLHACTLWTLGARHDSGASGAGVSKAHPGQLLPRHPQRAWHAAAAAAALGQREFHAAVLQTSEVNSVPAVVVPAAR